MMRQPRTGLAVLTLLGLIVSCGGSTQVNDPPIPSYPGHLAYIGADAEVVLSVNNLAERGRTIARSKAYAQFKQFLARVFEEDSGPVRDLAVDPDGTLDTYAELFAGRMTLVSYPTADSKAASPSGDEEENFVILTDADPRALIEAVESVDDTQGSFEEVGRGMMRYTSADPDSEPLFSLQHRGMGLIGSNPEVLTRTMQVAQGQGGSARLADDAAFKGLFDDLRQDADLFIWVRDWTSEQDSWDALMMGVPTATSDASAKSAAGTMMLDEGVDIEFVMELGAANLIDDNAKAFLSAMRNTSTSNTVADLLPSGTVGYLGFNLNLIDMLDEVNLDSLGTPLQAEMLRALFKQVAGAFSGEFGVAMTRLPTDPQAVSPMLDYPIPGLVFIARLAKPDQDVVVRRLLDTWLSSQTIASGGQFLGQRRDERIDAHDVVIYSTIDPTIEVAYTFHNGALLLGTLSGVSDMLKATATGPSALNIGSSAAIRQSLDLPSHYVLFLDLGAMYQFIQSQGGQPLPQLGALPDGDPLQKVFTVFRHAGGNLSFQEDRVLLRFYITADDLP